MATKTLGNAVVLEEKRLSKWRIRSPFMQTLIVCVVVFLISGMNSAILGLGAGGSVPSNIAFVDNTNIAGASITIVAGMLGGSINNKIGPRYSLMIAASSYPLWAGSLWCLDRGSGASFAYVAAIYHGIGAGLFYSTTGFIVSSYSTEGDRGRYIASFWAAGALGSAVSAAVLLGITSNSSAKRSSVPQSVYITIIVVQVVGVLCAGLLANPSSIKRNDGRPIAIFKSLGWIGELTALVRNLFNTRLLLLAPAIFASNMPLSLSGSLNAFYFDARTRALANLNFWVSAIVGWVIITSLCDSKFLGPRRQRVLMAAAATAIVLLATWFALLSFLTSNNLDRSKKAQGIDWNDGPVFSHLFVIYSFLGCSWALFQGGFVEGMRALGFAVAFGIDSRSVPFVIEVATYFALTVAGLVFCTLSASRYITDSSYGKEEVVVVPKAFQVAKIAAVSGLRH